MVYKTEYTDFVCNARIDAFPQGFITMPLAPQCWSRRQLAVT